MADVDKVIRALERCKAGTCPAIDSKEYAECEYTAGRYCGKDRVIADAIALLKEQETDIGNLNETVKKLLNAYTEIKAIYGDSVRVVGELIRCKDCKHYRYYGLSEETVSECTIDHCENPDADWFCADGERQEGR